MLRLFRHYIPAEALLIVALDAVITVGAVLLASRLSGWLGYGEAWPKAATLMVVVVLALYLADLYRLEVTLGRRELIAHLILAMTGVAVMTAAVGFAIPSLGFGRLSFVYVLTVLAIGLFGGRVVWSQLRPADLLGQRVLVLGAGPAVASLVQLQTTGSQPFTVLGVLDDRPEAQDLVPGGASLLGKPSDLLSLVDELRPDVVLVALTDMRRAFPADDLLECRMRGIAVVDWPTFYEKQTGKVLVTDLRPSWLIFSDGFVKTRLTQTVKRMVDITLATLGLVVSLPILVCAAMAIKLDSKGPVLFRQERVGQNGRIFVLRKFRSMTVDAESGSGAVWAKAGDPRITRVGRWLRRTRLDELPQFFNVLVGDMSFIGPRPERPEFVRMLQRQIPFYMQRHSVKPGITGWAQVRFAYAASVEDSVEKLQYDLYYIKNLSPLLDLLILLATIQVVLLARGSR